MTSYLLIISKNYWGSQVSEKNAINFLSNFTQILNILEKNTDCLLGDDVTIKNVQSKLSNFVSNCVKTSCKNKTSCKIFIYMNGHGGQIIDTDTNDESQELEPDSFDEIYHLPDGHLSDDDITQIVNLAVANANNFDIVFKTNQRFDIKSPPINDTVRPLIFLISDHCSSGSMIDKYTHSNKLTYDWITLGSSRDYQDSYISGDGHIMTSHFLDILKSFTSEQLKNISILEFFNILNQEIKSTFIGELQCLTLRVSEQSLYNNKIFD